jgi:hypothetical protein
MEFKEYTSFIVSLKERIKSAQYQALKAVNKEYIELCWDIGKSLSEKQNSWVGENRLWNRLQRTCRQNFMDKGAFRQEIYGL